MWYFLRAALWVAFCLVVLLIIVQLFPEPFISVAVGGVLAIAGGLYWLARSRPRTDQGG